MAVELEVCLSGKCTKKGAPMLLRDIEEASMDLAHVTGSRCLKKCSKGPNCREGSDRTVIKGLKKFSRIEAMLTDIIPGFEMSDLEREVSKLKFAARRAEESEDRMEYISKALSLLGPEGAVEEPKMLAQLLVMRSEELAESAPAMALQDALAATRLLPAWAFGQATLAQACEANGRFEEALAATERAISIGRGVDRRALKKKLAALGRKAQRESGCHASEQLQFSDCDGAEKEWQLQKIRVVNHDCFRMKFRCLGNATLGCADDPVWHVDLVAELGGDAVCRAYTPISTAEDFAKGKLDLLIKVYPQGIMTQHLAHLDVGARIAVSKPVPTLDARILGEGVVVIAGGSAVTLALQVCAAALKVRKPPEVHLFLCNKTVKDVVFAERFEELLDACPGFHVTHCISREMEKPPVVGRAVWTQGLLNAAVLQHVRPHLRAVVSGPPGLCRSACDAFRALGRSEESLLFLDELPEVLMVREQKGKPLKRARLDLVKASH